MSTSQVAQLDEVKIRISALRAIIDLLLLFGFQLLSETSSTQAVQPAESPAEQDAAATASAEEKEDTAQSTLTMLSEFLDSEVR